MSREELIKVFEDTKRLYNDPKIDKLIQKNVYFGASIYADELLSNEINFEEYEEKTPSIIKVTNRDTLSAAREYFNAATEDDTVSFVGVLNFASATTPGGGVKKGSSAQEEYLCRCTTLYPSLNQKYCWDGYYDINRNKHSNLGSDTIVYTRDVIVLKDKYYNKLPHGNRFYVDVITCAAPNLREDPNNHFEEGADRNKLTLADEELYEIHVRRARNIFKVAIENGVKYLVLGAFGCGAFKNNPRVVAKAYKDVLPEFTKYFKVIDFAIIGKNNNYDVFKKIIIG